ncbi:hypothetical protein RFI_37210, partial [Reticulomyxa filosa]
NERILSVEECFHLRNEQKYNLTLSQICLKWCIQHLIISLVKSYCGANERKYSCLCTSNTIIELSNEDMKKLNEMMKRKRQQNLFLFEMEEFFSYLFVASTSKQLFCFYCLAKNFQKVFLLCL